MDRSRFTINRELTASGKSVFWVLRDNDTNVCRVTRKKAGLDLAALINSGETEFGLDYVPKAYYITFKGERVCLTSKKSYNLLVNYLHENYNTPVTHQPLIRLQSSPESIRLSGSNSYSLLPSSSRWAGSDYLQAESSRAISILKSGIPNEAEFVERLEKYDQYLRRRVSTGECFIRDGEQLKQSECKLTRLVGEELVGTGQLIIGFANRERGIAECVLTQHEIEVDCYFVAEQQQRIAELITEHLTEQQQRIAELLTEQQRITEEQQRTTEDQQRTREHLTEHLTEQQRTTEDQQRTTEQQQDLTEELISYIKILEREGFHLEEKEQLEELFSIA